MSPGVFKAVHFIEIETSSKCSRKCTWCPTGLGLRPAGQRLMNWALFENIVHSLADDGYAGELSLHGLNEPLENERLFEEYDLLRRVLGRAKLTCYTNGDSLDSEKLSRFAELGLRRVRVTLHPARMEGVATLGRAEKRMISFLARLGVDLSDCSVLDGPSGTRRDFALGSMNVEVTQPHITEHFTDRGGSVSSRLALQQDRRSPCDAALTAIAISYDGFLKMCCNVTPDSEDHAPYMMADLNEMSLAAAYTSQRFRRWQALHAEANWEESPICRTCRHRVSGEDYEPSTLGRSETHSSKTFIGALQSPPAGPEAHTAPMPG